MAMNILDENGNPFGLEYDYEYRGRKREKNRDMPLVRSKIGWNAVIVACIVFSALSITAYITGSLALAGMSVLVLFFIILGTLCYFSVRGLCKKHNKLMDILNENSPRRFNHV
ncbi:MAG: hypothetical protein ACLVKO_07095 [Dysgonomonas sp.]